MKHIAAQLQKAPKPNKNEEKQRFSKTQPISDQQKKYRRRGEKNRERLIEKERNLLNQKSLISAWLDLLEAERVMFR
jgi:hypothetical protein